MNTQMARRKRRRQRRKHRELKDTVEDIAVFFHEFLFCFVRSVAYNCYTQRLSTQIPHYREVGPDQRWWKVENLPPTTERKLGGASSEFGCISCFVLWGGIFKVCYA